MLKERLHSDATSALKQGNQEIVGVLRMILASVSAREKEKRYKLSKDKPNLGQEDLIKESGLSDQEALDVLISEIKKRRDAIALFEKGNRPELAEREKKEIEIIQKYLPEQISAGELRKIIQESILKTGAKEMKDMGKIMADLMPKVKGRAENSEISKIVKELLS